jgi:arsenite-transporting ATPase
MLHDDNLTNDANYQRITDAKGLDELVNDLISQGKGCFYYGKRRRGKNHFSH